MSLLYLRENRNRLTRILASIFIVISVLFAKDFLLLLPQLRSNTLLYKLFLSIDNWVTPLWGVYLLEIVKPGGSLLRKFMFHLMPFILLTALAFIFFPNTITFILFGYTCLYGAGVAIFFLIKSRHYRQLIKENYSYNENIDVVWIYKLLGILMVYIIVWLYVSQTDRYVIDILYSLFSIGVCGFVFFKGRKQEELRIFDKKNSADSLPAQNEPPVNVELLREIKLFLNPHLTLADTALALGTNRTYLSNYLNQTLHTTFYDFINKLRVEYADELLSNPENNDTLETISEKSGFNSLSTFRRAFEKIHHCTPAEFRKKIAPS